MSSDMVFGMIDDISMYTISCKAKYVKFYLTVVTVYRQLCYLCILPKVISK